MTAAQDTDEDPNPTPGINMPKVRANVESSKLRDLLNNIDHNEE